MAVVPLPPQAGASDSSALATTTPEPVSATRSAPDYPVLLSIPAIGLKSPIEKVGVNEKGEMAVPSGNTDHVGWYADGVVPGDTGSAVIDAHVFAAFSKLNRLSVGSSLYVTMASGRVIHFIIQKTKTYPLAQVPLQELFNRDDTPRLNLITCAGTLTPDHSTYDRRLIEYATLAP